MATRNDEIAPTVHNGTRLQANERATTNIRLVPHALGRFARQDAIVGEQLHDRYLHLQQRIPLPDAVPKAGTERNVVRSGSNRSGSGKTDGLRWMLKILIEIDVPAGIMVPSADGTIVNDIPDVVVSCPSNMNVSTSSRMSAVLSGFPSIDTFSS
uniref:Uncharacterized protein n=1 Tax=Anopheles farauti TaxID=69004 RepID=A0A182QMB5_9DIPT